MKRMIGLLLALLLSACGGTDRGDTAPDPLPRGERILEIDITPAESRDYGAAFLEASRLGMQSTSLSLDWTVIETGLDSSVQPPQPIYQSDPDLDYLAIADYCYPLTDTGVSLTLRPIVTLAKNLPPDLQGLPLDDPRVIQRFEQLIDHVLEKLPNLRLTALVIGSEVDLYLTDPSRRSAWQSFFPAVAEYARNRYRALYPGRTPPPVGFEVTHKGLLGDQSSYYQGLMTASDLVGVSYYPMDERGQVQPPAQFSADVAALRRLYPDKPLYFFQLGYPSGFDPDPLYPELDQGYQPSIGSSAAKQADFIDAVFEVWDREAGHIAMIDFTWLHDLSAASVRETATNPAFGGNPDPDPLFYEFLRTLGLAGWSGDGAVLEKPAWERLREAAAVRGWPQSSKAFCQ